MQNKQVKKLTQLGLFAAVLGGAACSEFSDDAVLTQFYSETGAILSHKDLGYATTNNTLVHSGDRSYTYNLAKRFAEEAPSMVNFEFNSSALDAQAQAALIKQADWIKQFPEVRFKVFGYTDLVGTKAYNQRLGMRRARAVVNFLVRQGISRSRLAAVVSRGENQPLIQTTGPERQNRRAITEVSGFVKNHPTVLDGKYAQIVYRDYVASAQSETVITQGTILP